MNGQGKSSLLEVWSLPKNHYSIPCNKSKNCMSSTCAYTTERKEKRGEKLLHVKQKLWSFLFSNFIKQKRKTQQLFRLNLTILFYNQCPKRPIYSIFPFMPTYWRQDWATASRRPCRTEFALCSICLAAPTQQQNLGPFALSVISQRALCPDMKCSGILSPSGPAQVLLKLLGSPGGALASPAWPWSHRHGHCCGELLELAFPLFHCLLGWYIIHRRGEDCKHHCTSHFQTLPPLRKQEGQAQDKNFSHSCDCQDLKHLPCLMWEMN